ncbi:MAG: DUF4382 domain-containing protein [Proteobacteria bacterium]|nr:DUF4382 domain-containing protein [Pseudomonadota bacterium]
MFNIRLRRTVLASLAVVMLASACGGDGGSSATSSVQVSLTDTPIEDADSVVVSVSGVAFKPEGSAPEVVENFAPRSIDLLQYQNGRTAILLQDTPMQAGRYQWLRLIIDTQPVVRDSYIVINGNECELNVPSGAETGLKMNRPIDVPADGSLALTIDFDLRKSVHAPPGQASGACTTGYVLRPTLRLVNDANVGAIDGTVSFEAGAAPDGCKPNVYVYEGTVTPDDMEETTAASPDVDPLVVVGVTILDGSTSGTYRAAFIPAGSYTAAFTCDDDTIDDQSLAFVPPAGVAVAVQNNVISTVNFTVPVPAP